MLLNMKLKDLMLRAVVNDVVVVVKQNNSNKQKERDREKKAQS